MAGSNEAAKELRLIAERRSRLTAELVQIKVRIGAGKSRGARALVWLGERCNAIAGWFERHG